MFTDIFFISFSFSALNRQRTFQVTIRSVAWGFSIFGVSFLADILHTPWSLKDYRELGAIIIFVFAIIVYFLGISMRFVMQWFPLVFCIRMPLAVYQQRFLIPKPPLPTADSFTWSCWLAGGSLLISADFRISSRLWFIDELFRLHTTSYNCPETTTRTWK